jgi:hypothetical protein
MGFDEEKEAEDDRHERDAEELRNATVVVETINKFIGQRCCVFLDSYNEDDSIDAIHGRLMALIREWSALVVRDLTPGVERLQRKRIVPVASVRDLCLSPGGEQCVKCPTYKELQDDSGEKGEAGVQPA